MHNFSVRQNLKNIRDINFRVWAEFFGLRDKLSKIGQKTWEVRESFSYKSFSN